MTWVLPEHEMQYLLVLPRYGPALSIATCDQNVSEGCRSLTSYMKQAHESQSLLHMPKRTSPSPLMGTDPWDTQHGISAHADGPPPGREGLSLGVTALLSGRASRCQR